MFGGPGDPLTLDPGAITDESSQQSAQLIFEGLVRFNADREIEPALAQKWETSGRTWTFHLQSGVTFHDGTPFDAAAVKAHFDRIVSEKLFSLSNWTPYIDHIDAPDASTVIITTKDPDAFLLYRLAQIAGAIESPAAVKKYGKDIVKNPVGTGPFVFKEWIKDDHVLVVRNDSYWGQKAYLDAVKIRPIPDGQARLIALQSGDIQMAIGLTPEARDQLRGQPNIHIGETPSLYNTFIGMNDLKKPFNDVRVRQAMNYAVDKQTMIKNLYLGSATEVPGHVPPGTPGYVKTTGYSYDPAKAKQLLADAGYPNGFSTTLLSSTYYPKDNELIGFLQQQFAAVGVQVQLQELEWAKYLDQLRLDPRKSPVEMWRDNRGGSDASFSTLRTYGCDFYRPNGGNTNGFCDSKIDGLLTQGGTTIDATERNKLLGQAEQMLTDAAPSVWLFVTDAIAANSTKVHDPLLIRGGFFTPTEKTWLED